MIKQQKNQKPGKSGHSHPANPKTKQVSIKPLLIGTGVIVAIAFAVFSPCLTAEFLGWDDYNYIKENDLIKIFS